MIKKTIEEALKVKKPFLYKVDEKYYMMGRNVFECKTDIFVVLYGEYEVLKMEYLKYNINKNNLFRKFEEILKFGEGFTKKTSNDEMMNFLGELSEEERESIEMQIDDMERIYFSYFMEKERNY